MADFNSNHSNLENEFSQEVSGHDAGLNDARLANMASLAGQGPFESPTNPRNMEVVDLSDSANVDLENSNFNATIEQEPSITDEEIALSAGTKVLGIKNTSDDSLFCVTETGIFRRVACAWEKVGEYTDGMDISASGYTPVDNGFHFWYDSDLDSWHMKFIQSGIGDAQLKWIEPDSTVEIVSLSINSSNRDMLLATRNHGVYFYHDGTAAWTRCFSEGPVNDVLCGETSFIMLEDLSLYYSSNRCHSFDKYEYAKSNGPVNFIYESPTTGKSYFGGNVLYSRHRTGGEGFHPEKDLLPFPTIAGYDETYLYTYDGVYIKTRDSRQAFVIDVTSWDSDTGKLTASIKVTGDINVGDFIYLYNEHEQSRITSITKNTPVADTHIVEITTTARLGGISGGQWDVLLTPFTKISDHNVLDVDVDAKRFVDVEGELYSVSGSTVTQIPLSENASALSTSGLYTLTRNLGLYEVIDASGATVLSFSSDNEPIIHGISGQDEFVIIDGNSIKRYTSAGTVSETITHPIVDIDVSSGSHVVSQGHSIFNYDTQQLVDGSAKNPKSWLVEHVMLVGEDIHVVVKDGLLNKESRTFKSRIGSGSWKLVSAETGSSVDSALKMDFSGSITPDMVLDYGWANYEFLSKNDSSIKAVNADATGAVNAYGDDIYANSVNGVFKNSAGDFYYHGSGGLNVIRGIANESNTFVFSVRVDSAANTMTVLGPSEGLSKLAILSGLKIYSRPVENLNYTITSVSTQVLISNSFKVATGDLLVEDEVYIRPMTVLNPSYGDGAFSLVDTSRALYTNYPAIIYVADIVSIVGNVITFSRPAGVEWAGADIQTISITGMQVGEINVTAEPLDFVTDNGSTITIPYSGLPVYDALKNYKISIGMQSWDVSSIDNVNDTITIQTQECAFNKNGEAIDISIVSLDYLSLVVSGICKEAFTSDSFILRVSDASGYRYIYMTLTHVRENSTFAIHGALTSQLELSDLIFNDIESATGIEYKIFRIPSFFSSGATHTLLSYSSATSYAVNRDASGVCENALGDIYYSIYGEGLYFDNGTSGDAVANSTGTKYLSQITASVNDVIGISHDSVFRFTPTSGATGTWSDITPSLLADRKAEFTSIAADGLNVYLGTKNHGVLSSADGGATWSSMAAIEKAYTGDVRSSGNLLYSKEIGLFEIDYAGQQALGIGKTLYNEKVVRVSSDGAGNMAVVCSGNSAFYSTDSGATWNKLPLSFDIGEKPLIAMSQDFATDETIVVGDGLNTYITRNTGMDWEQLSVSTKDNLHISGQRIITDSAISTDMGETWSSAALGSHLVSPVENDPETVFAYRDGQLKSIVDDEVSLVRNLHDYARDICIREASSTFDFSSAVISASSATTVTGTFIHASKNESHNLYVASSTSLADYGDCTLLVSGSLDGTVPLVESVYGPTSTRISFSTDNSYSLAAQGSAFTVSGICEITIDAMSGFNIADGALVGLYIELGTSHYRICRNWIDGTAMKMHIASSSAPATGIYNLKIGRLVDDTMLPPYIMMAINLEDMFASLNLGLTHKEISLAQIDIDSVTYDTNQFVGACEDLDRTYVLLYGVAFTLFENSIESSVNIDSSPYITGISLANDKIWGRSSSGLYYIPKSSWGVTGTWTNAGTGTYTSRTGSAQTFTSFASNIFASRHNSKAGYVFVSNNAGIPALLYSSDFGTAIYRECALASNISTYWAKLHIATSPVSAQIAVHCDGKSAYITKDSGKTWSKIASEQDVLFADFEASGSVILYCADGNAYRYGSDGLMLHDVVGVYAHGDKILTLYSSGASLFVDDGTGRRIKHFNNTLHGAKKHISFDENDNPVLFVYGFNGSELMVFDFETETFSVQYSYPGTIRNAHYIHENYNVATSAGIYINDEIVEKYGEEPYRDFIRGMSGDNLINEAFEYVINDRKTGQTASALIFNSSLSYRSLAANSFVSIDPSSFTSDYLLIQSYLGTFPSVPYIESGLTPTEFFTNSLKFNITEYNVDADDNVLISGLDTTQISNEHVRCVLMSDDTDSTYTTFEFNVMEDGVVKVLTSQTINNPSAIIFFDKYYTFFIGHRTELASRIDIDCGYDSGDLLATYMIEREYRSWIQRYIRSEGATSDVIIAKPIEDFEIFSDLANSAHVSVNIGKIANPYANDNFTFSSVYSVNAPVNKLALALDSFCEFLVQSGPDLMAHTNTNGLRVVQSWANNKDTIYLYENNTLLDTINSSWLSGWDVGPSLSYIDFGIPEDAGYNYTAMFSDYYHLLPYGVVEHTRRQQPPLFIGETHILSRHSFWSIESSVYNAFPKMMSGRAFSTPSRITFDDNSLVLAWTGSEQFPCMTVSDLSAFSSYQLPSALSSITHSPLTGRPQEHINCLIVNSIGSVLAGCDTSVYSSAAGSWNVELFTGNTVLKLTETAGGYALIESVGVVGGSNANYLSWSDSTSVYSLVQINDFFSKINTVFVDDNFGVQVGTIDKSVCFIGGDENSIYNYLQDGTDIDNVNLVDAAFDEYARKCAIVINTNRMFISDNHGRNWFQKTLTSPCRNVDWSGNLIAMAIDTSDNYSMDVEVSSDMLETTSPLSSVWTGTAPKTSSLSVFIGSSKIYIGTEGQGLWQYDRSSNILEPYRTSPTASLTNETINCLSENADGLYIGTQDNGAVLLSGDGVYSISSGLSVADGISDIDAGTASVMSINGANIMRFNGNSWSQVGDEIVSPYAVFIRDNDTIQNIINVPASTSLIILRAVNMAPDFVPEDGIDYSVGQTISNSTVIFNDTTDVSGKYTDTSVVRDTVYYYSAYVVDATSGSPVYTLAPRLHLGEIYSYDETTLTEATFAGVVDVAGVTYHEYDDTTIIRIVPDTDNIGGLLGTNLVGKTITIGGTPYTMEYCYKNYVYLPGDLTTVISAGAAYSINPLPSAGEYEGHMLNANIRQLLSAESGVFPLLLPISSVDIGATEAVYTIDSHSPAKKISLTPGIQLPALHGFNERISTLFEITSIQRRVAELQELVFAIDGTHVIYKSENNGRTFSQFATAAPGTIRDIAIGDDTDIYLATSVGLYKYSGAYALLLAGDFKALYRTDDFIVAVAADGKIHYSSNEIDFTVIHDLALTVSSASFTESAGIVTYQICTSSGLYGGEINTNFQIKMSAMITSGNILTTSISDNKPGDSVYMTKNLLEIQSNGIFGYDSAAEAEFTTSSWATVVFKAEKNGIAVDADKITVGAGSVATTNPVTASRNATSVDSDRKEAIIEMSGEAVAALHNGSLLISYDLTGDAFNKVSNPALGRVNDIEEYWPEVGEASIIAATDSGNYIISNSGEISVSSHQGSKATCVLQRGDSVMQGGEFGLVLSTLGRSSIITPSTFDPSAGVAISWSDDPFVRPVNKNGLDNSLIDYFAIDRTFVDYTLQPPRDVLATKWAGTVIMRQPVDQIMDLKPMDSISYEAGDRVHPEPIRFAQSGMIKFPDNAVVAGKILSTTPNNMFSAPEFGVDTFFHDVPFIDNVNITQEGDATNEYGASRTGALLEANSQYAYRLYPYFERPPYFVFQASGNTSMWAPIYSSYAPEWFHYTIPISCFTGATKITCLWHDGEYDYAVGTDNGLFVQTEDEGFAQVAGTDGLYIHDIRLAAEMTSDLYLATDNGIYESNYLTGVTTQTSFTGKAYKFDVDSDGRTVCGTERGIYALSATGWVFESVCGGATSLAQNAELTQRIR